MGTSNPINTTADVTGIIIPHNWDEVGRIIEIALYTNTEEIYGVEHNSLTQGLMHFMHKRIVVKGIIKDCPGGAKSIAVQNYFVLEDIVDDDKKTI
jgi:hypothetical protein